MSRFERNGKSRYVVRNIVRITSPTLQRLGILPRDGKNISFREMSTAIRNTYNFAPSFCYFVPKYMADLLTRDYNKDTIDLSDIDVHNGIEHDGSLFRKIFARFRHCHFLLSNFATRTWHHLPARPIKNCTWSNWRVPFIRHGTKQYRHCTWHVCSTDST